MKNGSMDRRSSLHTDYNHFSSPFFFVVASELSKLQSAGQKPGHVNSKKSLPFLDSEL